MELEFRTVYEYFDQTTCATVYVSQETDPAGWHWYIEDIHDHVVRHADILYSTAQDAMVAAAIAFEAWDIEQTPEEFR